jgi:2-pyrone-4,6-dicarboxylate lactonase
VIQENNSPKVPLPPLAWDCHAHVFGPFDAYPLLPRRRYDPPLAPTNEYLRVLDSVGFAHGVLVHASAYGFDNTCTRDALRASNDRVLGVCVVEPTVSDQELERLHADGFRAIRVTVTGARVQQYTGSLDFEDLKRFAPRLKALGWHAQVWANCNVIVDAAKQLAAHDIPIVFDHMGYFDSSAGVGDATFQSFLSILGNGDFWIKTTPIRLSKTDPSYESIRPFHESILRVIPDRTVFGSDWPYISMEEWPSRTRFLVDLFDSWTPDAALRRKIFVDNPARLYRRAA